MKSVTKHILVNFNAIQSKNVLTAFLRKIAKTVAVPNLKNKKGSGGLKNEFFQTLFFLVITHLWRNNFGHLKFGVNMGPN